MTLLTALQWVQRQCSLPVTTSIVGDAQETQQLLFALAQEEAEELAARHDWPELLSSATFTGPGTINGAQSEFSVPADWDRPVNDTFWNDTADAKIRLVQMPEWVSLLRSGFSASQMSPVYLVSNVDVAGALIIRVQPVAPTGHALRIVYVRDTPVRSSGGALQANFEADTDVFLLGDDLLERGVRWRYLAQKGLDYAEHMKSYERWVQNRINAKTGAGDVDLGARRDVLPLATIPEGDW
jgi:hypothetical protein